jgi:hypothetical protein
MTNEEKIEQAIIRMRSGEMIYGSYMYDHGLPDGPIVGCSRMSYKDGVFLYRTWLEEPVVPIVEFDVKQQTLTEEEARACLLSDSKLRDKLGLPGS